MTQTIGGGFRAPDMTFGPEHMQGGRGTSDTYEVIAINFKTPLWIPCTTYLSFIKYLHTVLGLDVGVVEQMLVWVGQWSA